MTLTVNRLQRVLGDEVSAWQPLVSAQRLLQGLLPTTWAIGRASRALRRDRLVDRPVHDAR